MKKATDEHHTWARDQFSLLETPLLICEPVLTEACYLIEKRGSEPRRLVQKVADGTVKIALEVASEVKAICALMDRYRAVPMSLADACLVRMAELYDDSMLLTIDRDFLIYRKQGRQVIPTFMPSDLSP